MATVRERRSRSFVWCWTWESYPLNKNKWNMYSNDISLDHHGPYWTIKSRSCNGIIRKCWMIQTMVKFRVQPIIWSTKTIYLDQNHPYNLTSKYVQLYSYTLMLFETFWYFKPSRCHLIGSSHHARSLGKAKRRSSTALKFGSASKKNERGYFIEIWVTLDN